jgi:hypothetical protein
MDVSTFASIAVFLAEPRDEGTSRAIPTAELLLHMPGIEVAARPWLYPMALFGYTHLRVRLVGLGHISAAQKPSLKTSWLRKLLSRCASYQQGLLPSILFMHWAGTRQIRAPLPTLPVSRRLCCMRLHRTWQQFGSLGNREAAKLEAFASRHTATPDCFSPFACRQSGASLDTRACCNAGQALYLLALSQS